MPVATSPNAGAQGARDRPATPDRQWRRGRRTTPGPLIRNHPERTSIAEEDYAQIATSINTGFEWLPTEDADFHRAWGVSAALAQTSRHRAVGLADLLVAAVGERHRVTILHYHADYDLVGEITQQPMQWVVPHGAVS